MGKFILKSALGYEGNGKCKEPLSVQLYHKIRREEKLLHRFSRYAPVSKIGFCGERFCSNEVYFDLGYDSTGCTVGRFRLFCLSHLPDRMKLLHLAIAYLGGVTAGHFLWQQGWFGCGISDLYWITALALIALFLWMDAKVKVRVSAPLRWPAAAGFAPPRGTPSGWLIGGIVLAGMCGILRLGSQPPQPCLGPSDLAYYNGDAGGRENSWAVLDGYVARYPILKDGPVASGC